MLYSHETMIAIMATGRVIFTGNAGITAVDIANRLLVTTLIAPFLRFI
jgi:hypothetical protein